MLRNLGIRGQILSALALPVLALAGLTVYVTSDATSDMRESRTSLESAEGSIAVAALVSDLQAERELSAARLAGTPRITARLTRARSDVDAGLATLRNGLFSRPGLSPRLTEAFDLAAQEHARLDRVRGSVDSRTLGRAGATAAYGQIIAADVAIPDAIAKSLDDTRRAQNFERLSAVSRAIETLSVERLVGLDVLDGRRPTAQQQRMLGAAEAAYADAFADFDRVATPEHEAALNRAMAGSTPSGPSYDELRERISDAGTSRTPKVSAAAWARTNAGQVERLREVQTLIGSDIVEEGRQGADAARSRAVMTVGGALALTALMLLLALLISRRIAAPMRRLTEAATRVRDELPEVVARVDAGDLDAALEPPQMDAAAETEVGRLAAAFEDVNAAAVRTAREQAMLRSAVGGMFVNVARRNQVLLSRQLSFIDHLERTEENPDSLENLFRLDHLATRMRRNAESLLVLAGVESGRRLRRSMPLSDVIRTAASEIEHYGRVSLALQDDPPVYAHLALPTAHLVAELLENATNFSDPGSQVIVSAAAGADGVLVTVTDSGLGMTEEELAEANIKIAEPPAAEAIGSQRLGFFVIGRLAQRLDAAVTLTSGRARGTVVRIELPASLFEAGALAELPAAAPALTADQDLADDQDARPVREQSAVDSVPELPQRTPAVPQVPAPGLPAVEPAEASVEAPADAPSEASATASAEEQHPSAEEDLSAAPSLFSGFRARREGVSPVEPAEPAEPAPPLPQQWAPGDDQDFEVGPAYTPESFQQSDSGVAAADAVPPLPDREPVVQPSPQPSFVQPLDVEPEPEPQFAPPPGLEPEPQPEFVPQLQLEPEPQPRFTSELHQPEPVPSRQEAVEPLADEPVTHELVTHEPVTDEPVTDEPVIHEPVIHEPVTPEPFHEPATHEQIPAHAMEAVADEVIEEYGPRRVAAAQDVLPQRSALRSAFRRSRKSQRPAVPQAREVTTPPPAARSLPAPRAEQPAPGPDEELIDASSGTATDTSVAGALETVPAQPDSATESSAPPAASLASQALTELSRLSSYSPAAVQDGGSALRRRPPAEIPPPEPEPAVGTADQRARTAANVRAMLAGFKAGVERGRTSPSAYRPASGGATQPPQQSRRDG